jgi:hypothetical protein
MYIFPCETRKQASEWKKRYDDKQKGKGEARTQMLKEFRYTHTNTQTHNQPIKKHQNAISNQILLSGKFSTWSKTIINPRYPHHPSYPPPYPPDPQYVTTKGQYTVTKMVNLVMNPHPCVRRT